MTLLARHKDIARSSALLASVSDDIAEKLFSCARVRSYSRGTSLFLQGERVLSVMIVLDGWVKLYRTTRNGAEAVVGVHTRGSSFGEAMMFQKAHYPVAAEAATACKLMLIDFATVKCWTRQEPDLVFAMLSSSYSHMRTLIAQIEQLKAKTGAQRLAAFLLELCPCEDGACTVTLPYEKVLIAGRLGLKPESLSRAFARLKSTGVAVHHSNAAIADVGALRRYAEEDRAEAWSRAL